MFSSSRLNLNNKYAAELRISLPKLAVAVDYDVRGSRLLTLDISGKGHLTGNFSKFYHYIHMSLYFHWR